MLNTELNPLIIDEINLDYNDTEIEEVQRALQYIDEHLEDLRFRVDENIMGQINSDKNGLIVGNFTQHEIDAMLDYRNNLANCYNALKEHREDLEQVLEELTSSRDKINNWESAQTEQAGLLAYHNKKKIFSIEPDYGKVFIRYGDGFITKAGALGTGTNKFNENGQIENFGEIELYNVGSNSVPVYFENGIILCKTEKKNAIFPAFSGLYFKNICNKKRCVKICVFTLKNPLFMHCAILPIVFHNVKNYCLTLT